MGESKITQLGDITSADDNVLRLDVTVHNVASMKVRYSTDLQDELSEENPPRGK